ncbi:MAG: hypothetical protein J6Q22_10320 [Prevotella sp.]|nr:hypothetical protein [Prevotella sp.]
MADNYFDYLYGANGKQEKAVTDENHTTPDTVAQDEAIGKPWTHRFTIYCANPAKEFIDSLKKNECVVAVYEKAKEAGSTPAEKTEPKANDAPSNE